MTPWFLSFKSPYLGQSDIGWQKSLKYTMHVIRLTYRSFWKTVNIIQCDEGRDENFFNEFAPRQLYRNLDVTRTFNSTETVTTNITSRKGELHEYCKISLILVLLLVKT